MINVRGVRVRLHSYIELRMAHQHLRALAGRVGQARALDRAPQAVLAQRALAHPDPAAVRRLPQERVHQDVRGHHQPCVLRASRLAPRTVDDLMLTSLC